MVNLIGFVELRDHVRDRGWMPEGEPSYGCCMGGDGAFTLELQAVLAMIVGID
jgi:hypothetical protein